MPTGRPRIHSDNARKQRAYRARKAKEQHQEDLRHIQAAQREEWEGYGTGSGVKYETIRKLLACGLIEKRDGYSMFRVKDADQE